MAKAGLDKVHQKSEGQTKPEHPAAKCVHAGDHWIFHLSSCRVSIILLSVRLQCVQADAPWTTGFIGCEFLRFVKVGVGVGIGDKD